MEIKSELNKNPGIVNNLEIKKRPRYIYSNLSKEEIEEVRELTYKTRDKLYKKTLEMANGDEKKRSCYFLTLMSPLISKLFEKIFGNFLA